jgi:PAS domain S-box-containing protein
VAAGGQFPQLLEKLKLFWKFVNTKTMKKHEPRKTESFQKPTLTTKKASKEEQEPRRIQEAFLSHLRHEMRTPLNAIIGYSEMLREDAEDLDQKVFIPDLKAIQSAADQMLRHLNDILDPSKIQARPKDVDPESIEVKLRNELRTPLNTIVGCSGMLLEKAKDQGQDEFILDLQKIHTAAKNFSELINKIHNFSKIKAGVMTPNLGAPDASSPIHDTVTAIPPITEKDTTELLDQRGSLLVVDDDEMNRDLLSRQLERLGHKVMVTENGRQALEAIKAHNFDLVLLDIIMPEISGFQVLQKLRKHGSWRHIPVIMISAVDEMDSVVRCIEMGAEDYLPKPFDPVLLRARVGACLEKKRLRDMERKHSEEALRESEEKYQTILPNIEDGYYEVDLAGNMTFFNDAMCRILRYSKDELKGMNYRQYMSEDNARIVYRTFNKVLRMGKPTKGFDWELIRKDGEKRFLETSVSLKHDAKGIPVGFRGIARDITQRKKIIQELEALNQAKEKILSHLSHELITPIGLIEASLERLYKRELPESLKEKNLQRIQRHLDRVKDLQEISQEILHPYQYIPQPFQVDTTLRGILENLRIKAAHRKVAIITQLESLITDIIDPRILNRVADTLVKNAIESTPDEGEIIVSLVRATKGVWFKVEDRGVGIAENDLDFIFTGFHHTQHTEFYSTKRPFDFNAGGKGLELMDLKALSTEGGFNLSFESKRCRHIPTNLDNCCGRTSSCPHITSTDECIKSGGTTFSVLFFKKRSQEKL